MNIQLRLIISHRNLKEQNPIIENAVCNMYHQKKNLLLCDDKQTLNMYVKYEEVGQENLEAIISNKQPIRNTYLQFTSNISENQEFGLKNVNIH